MLIVFVRNISLIQQTREIFLCKNSSHEHILITNLYWEEDRQRKTYVIVAPYVGSVGHIFPYLYTLDDDSERPMDYKISLLPKVFP